MESKSKTGGNYSLLLAEDDKFLADTLSEFLEGEGYVVYRTDRCKGAIDILREIVIHVAIVDKKLTDCEGTEIAEFISQEGLKTKMILMTAYGPDEKIKEFIKKGAFDFIEKPVDMAKLLKRIDNASRMFLLESSNEIERNKLESRFEIVGESESIKKVKESVRLIAGYNSSVLIYGETGTGKELIARNIHLLSDRKDRMFLSINCASIPENLFESEFFGYEKGAFTGAADQKKGYFEMANYGVLHLDEIGEMPPGFQAKLLRVLENGTFLKVGGTREIKVDVRVVASTNKNLLAEIKKDKFREDLYFRLAVFTITIPPLRERREDIRVIAEHIWRNLKNEIGVKEEFESFPLNELLDKEWKGNVRELRNYLERRMIYATVDSEDSREIDIREKESGEDVGVIKLDEYVRDYVIYVLKKFKYNKTRTAAELGMSLSTLKRWISRWGLSVKKSLDK